MSIVALKRNSRRYQVPISGRGHEGFSLVGGHRNIGSVGPTNLAKSVTRTPFRGTAPMGNGGCCGTFVISIANSGSCNTNDPGIIKKTVKNNKGSIIQQYKWIHSAYPRLWTKNGATMPGNFSQGEYIKNVVAGSATCVVDKVNSGINDCGGNLQCKAAEYHIGGKKYYRSFYSKNLKPYPTSCSQYQISALMKKNNLPTPPCLAPFPMVLNNQACVDNLYTPQQAIDAGLLPEDWMNCNPALNTNCVENNITN